MAITPSRSCKVTLTGTYSIYAPPHSEFRGIGSVEKYLNVEVKKFMKEAKLLLQKTVLCLMKKLPAEKLGIISSNLHIRKRQFRHDCYELTRTKFYERNILRQCFKLYNPHIKDSRCNSKII